MYLRFLQRGSPRANLEFNKLWIKDRFILGTGEAHQGRTLGLSSLLRSKTHQGRTLGLKSLWSCNQGCVCPMFFQGSSRTNLGFSHPW